MNKVLMVGLRADAVDFSKWPELTEDKLNNAFKQILEDCYVAGIDAEWCLTDRGETAVDVLSSKLRGNSYDVVLIGAGVRVDPDHFKLFEMIINSVHELSPGSKIAFNTNPFDTIEAIQRWL